MNTVERIYQNVQGLPEFQAEEVLRFIDSLKFKKAAVNQEEALIKNERAIYLTTEDMAVFFAALEHPAKANQYLKRAAQRHQQLIGRA